MNQALHRWLAAGLRLTRAELFPVRARGGYNAGARWTLHPWTAYWQGRHEPVVSNALAQLGDLRGQVCWDLGAHFGYYAVGFAQRVGPAGQVLAVEPLPSNFARLLRHRNLNRLDGMKCLCAAASDRDGESELIADPVDGDTGGHLAYDANERARPGVPVLRIRTLRLDGVVERGEARPPALVKVDVEGHGHRALAGAAETIRRARPLIVMAFHSRIEVDGTAALLDPLGYDWHALQPGPDGGKEGGDFLLRPT
ncbi:MAG: FkbM family methyltransferase [Opitutae bacterium]|nr:FkbM family methyltransferase [Opitutae bacterium]